MSEIQSAEEFALKIERIGQMRCVNPDCKVCAEHKKEAAALVRARDKAWVERIKETFWKLMPQEKRSDETIYFTSAPEGYVNKIFDVVLRELGGGQ